MRRPINRRAFLRGAGRSIIALPLLDAMSFAGKARASTGPPKRFILLFSKNGTVWNEFRPQGFGGLPDQAIPAGALGGKRITSQFSGHEDRLLLMEGLNDICAHPPGGPAGPTNGAHIVSVITLATGRQPTSFDTSTSSAQGAIGPSFDYVLAQWIGASTRYRQIDFGVGGYAPNNDYIINYGPGGTSRGVGYTNPKIAFSDLFSSIQADPAELHRLREQKRSVLDGVKDDYALLLPRLSRDDRARLQLHLDSVREIEVGLLSAPAVCSQPAPIGAEPTDSSAIPWITDRNFELAVNALKCDLTRVVTMYWRTDAAPSWLGSGIGQHALGHGAAGSLDEPSLKNTTVAAALEQFTQLQVWYAAQVAKLVQMLKSMPDGNGTLFDNTCVLWCNEYGVGGHHEDQNLPFALFSGPNMPFRGGRYLNAGNRPHNDLFAAIARGFGIPDSKFGDPTICTGPFGSILA